MPDATRLNKSEVVAGSILTGATTNIDIDTGFHDSLTVQAQMTGAASGDLTVTVVPFQGDGVTLQPAAFALPALRTVAPAFAGGKVNFWAQFDVQGFEKVRVGFKNNNAGTQTIDRATCTLGPLEG